MKINKLILSCRYPAPIRSSLGHHSQSSYYLREIFFGKIRLQHFSLGSCLFNTESDKNSQSKELNTSKSSQLVSEKDDKLSKLEEKDIEYVEKLKKGDLLYPYKSPGERIKSLLLQDMKSLGSDIVKFFTGVTIKNAQPEYFLKHTDILIIGGGPVGLSIAHAIRSKFPFGPKITVIDKQSTFPPLSTNLSQGVVSFQRLDDEENFEALKYGAEFFSSFSRITEVNGHPPFKLLYDPLGSLVLVDNSNIERVLKINEKLKDLKVYNKILDRAALKYKFPWLNADNVLFGSLGMCCEGVIDPWAFLFGLKAKSINLGVNFVTAEVTDFGFEREDIRRAICKLPNGTYNFIDFSYCIIAGGMESLNLVNILNEAKDFNLALRLPLEQRVKYEFCLYCPKGPELSTPIVINSDGICFRREGLTGHYVASVNSVVNNESNKNVPQEVFENKVKPFLIKRLPFLKDLDIVRGWFDVYDYCISNNVGITGPHPETTRIIFALGFSHLGFQYLPAVGRALMEYIIYGEYKTINFEPYHIENLWRKHHLEEDRKKRELLDSQQRVSLSE